MNGSELIAAERQRQVDREGWTPEHDDAHDGGELLYAARAYTFAASTQTAGGDTELAAMLLNHAPPWWPWDRSWWKPTDDPIRNLVKAGALIAAEIDRLQRACAAPYTESEEAQ